MALILERLCKKYMREVDDFCCGVEYVALEDFLKGEAFSYNYNGEGNTYVLWSDKLNRIVAYYTLRCNSIIMEDSSKENDKLSVIPSIELSRFAVDHRNQNNHLGQDIFWNYIIPQIYYIRKLIAVEAILVFSLDDARALHVYKNLGFEEMPNKLQTTIEYDNEKCISMIIELKNNEKLFKKIEQNSMGVNDIEKIIKDNPEF